METTFFNPAQQRILHLMSYIKTEEELNSLEKALLKYFANKVDEDVDALCEQGAITLETIEKWGNEHLRTPYQ
ncbi:MAG: hypothetical protein J1E77_06310 [Prevotella sp.]|nr:hypothetical protein [Prevotella sp.]